MSFDVARAGDKGEIISQEQADTEAGSVKILIVRDGLSEAVFGHVVPKKSIGEKESKVDVVVEDVNWLGYLKIMFKTDNNPTTLKLLVYDGAEDPGSGEGDG